MLKNKNGYDNIEPLFRAMPLYMAVAFENERSGIRYVERLSNELFQGYSVADPRSDRMQAERNFMDHVTAFRDPNTYGFYPSTNTYMGMILSLLRFNNDNMDRNARVELLIAFDLTIRITNSNVTRKDIEYVTSYLMESFKDHDFASIEKNRKIIVPELDNVVAMLNSSHLSPIIKEYISQKQKSERNRL